MSFQDEGPFTDVFGKKALSTKIIKRAINSEVSEVGGFLSFTCVLREGHGMAKVEITPKGLTGYYCDKCLDPHWGQENLNGQFQRWLNNHAPQDDIWPTHTNPYDYKGNGAELAFWSDAEGNPLLYRGGIHFLYGKPATLKSWFALNLLHEADVRLWDFENGLAGTRDRLKALGIPKSQAYGYASPETSDELLSRVEHYTRQVPDVLVIDGFSGLADLMNVNPDSNTEVMSLFGEVFNPLKKVGVTVVVIDHLPKDSQSIDYPIGAQAKRSQADVTIYFKGTQSDKTVELYVSKDRHGSLNLRCEPGLSPRKLGTLTLNELEGELTLAVKPAYAAEINGTKLSEQDAATIAAIYTYVEQNQPCSKTEVETNVPGKNDKIRKAIQELVDLECLHLTKKPGMHALQTGKPLDLQFKPLGLG
jgi:AAA domain